MGQITHFIMQHPYLWGALVVVIGLLILLELEASLRGIRRLAPADVSLIINRKGVLVDINETDLFNKGHILGAIHIPFSEWAKKVASLDAHKTSVVVLVANEERQALQAAKLLKQQGFSEVAVLAGGLAAWHSANFPLVKK